MEILIENYKLKPTECAKNRFDLYEIGEATAKN